MANQKKALIIGISSQDGSYLAEHLLNQNYRVVGTLRRSTRERYENISHLYGRVGLEYYDLIDGSTIYDILLKHKPDEIYVLAAMSVPADSWNQPINTLESTGVAPVRILEAARKVVPTSKLYLAVTREIFGDISGEANEDTPVRPNNLYGVAKAQSYFAGRSYRDAYGMFVCCGILFNHESPRRPIHFITRKISVAIACILNNVDTHSLPVDENGVPVLDSNRKVHVGNLDATRDWGYAKEYAVAMWQMLQQSTPQDYVIGTGSQVSVRQMIEEAFASRGLDWREHVIEDKEYYRRTEIKSLVADSSKAKRDLNWEAHLSVHEIMKMMIDNDLKNTEKRI